MKNITNILLVVLIIFAAIGIFKSHSLDLNISEHKNNNITISGKAEKTIAPDAAKISFAVNEYNVNQKIAADKVNKKIKSIIETLENLNIKNKDIKTQRYSIYPNYNWNNGDRTFKDYKVSQSVEVKIKDLENLPKVIARITELKVDNFNGPNMYFENIDKIKDSLREEAIDNAKEKAGELASELGVELDKIVGFSESNNSRNYYSQPMYKSLAMSDSMAEEKIEEPVINPGEEKIVKTVSITFKIED